MLRSVSVGNLEKFQELKSISKNFVAVSNIGLSSHLKLLLKVFRLLASLAAETVRVIYIIRYILSVIYSRKNQVNFFFHEMPYR